MKLVPKYLNRKHQCGIQIVLNARDFICKLVTVGHQDILHLTIGAQMQQALYHLEKLRPAVLYSCSSGRENSFLCCHRCYHVVLKGGCNCV